METSLPALIVSDLVIMETRVLLHEFSLLSSIFGIGKMKLRTIKNDVFSDDDDFSGFMLVSHTH